MSNELFLVQVNKTTPSRTARNQYSDPPHINHPEKTLKKARSQLSEPKGIKTQFPLILK